MRLSIAFVALALAAAPAAAEEVTIRIPVEEADLATEAGFAALKVRIVDAAAEACASEDWVLSRTPVANCKATLIRKAFAEAEGRRAEAAQP